MKALHLTAGVFLSLTLAEGIPSHQFSPLNRLHSGVSQRANALISHEAELVQMRETFQGIYDEMDEIEAFGVLAIRKKVGNETIGLGYEYGGEHFYLYEDVKEGSFFIIDTNNVMHRIATHDELMIAIKAILQKRYEIQMLIEDALRQLEKRRKEIERERQRHTA